MTRRATHQAGLDPRTCTGCGSSFQPYRDSQKTCGNRKCRESQPHVVDQRREFYARPEVRERKNAARRVTLLDGEKLANQRLINLRNNLRQYGMTPEDYEQKLADQQGVCALCGRPPTPGGTRAASRLHVDHHHQTGKVRDLLCSSCNGALGAFRDDPELLRTAAEYVERHRDRHSVAGLPDHDGKKTPR